MKKFKLIKKDEYANYILEDSNNNKYEVNINFIDIEPQINDYIFLNEKILSEDVSLNYGIMSVLSTKREHPVIL
jgi:hypothetical protein